MSIKSTAINILLFTTVITAIRIPSIIAKVDVEMQEASSSLTEEPFIQDVQTQAPDIKPTSTEPTEATEMTYDTDDVEYTTDVEELKDEISRLEYELEQANSDSSRNADYGDASLYGW